MNRRKPADLEVDGALTTLGVTWLCQWDVLVFLYRHRSSLVSAEHIARLLGYPTKETVAALTPLESLGLVERSRAHRGVRLYQFTAPQDSRHGDALERLLSLADNREGRLLLSKKLKVRRDDSPNPHNGDSRSGAQERSATWRRAV